MRLLNYHKSIWAIRVVISLILVFTIYWIAFDFMRWNQFDSPGFVGGARLLFGLDGGYDFQSRMTKPLVLIFPGLMEAVFGLHPNVGFIIQNAFLFFFTGWLMFQTLKIIFKDERKAFLGFLAFIMCQPFAIYSLMVLSDIAGWFFIVLGMYLGLKYLENPVQKRLIIYSVILSMGLFAKESAVVGMLFFGSVLLLEKKPVKWKIKSLGTAFVSYAVPFVLIFLLLQSVFGDSILGRIGEAHEATRADQFRISKLWQLYHTVDVYWLLAGLGLYSVFRRFSAFRHDLPVKSALLALTLSFVLMPVWPYFVDRILFMIAPLLMIFLIIGLQYLRPAYQLILIVAGGLISLVTTWLIYHEGIPGLLEKGILFYGSLIGIFLLFSRKKTPGPRIQSGNIDS